MNYLFDEKDHKSLKRFAETKVAARNKNIAEDTAKDASLNFRKTGDRK